MLAVGYSLTADNRSGYVIVKNSWGGDWGQDGYAALLVPHLSLQIYSLPEPPLAHSLLIGWNEDLVSRALYACAGWWQIHLHLLSRGSSQRNMRHEFAGEHSHRRCDAQSHTHATTSAAVQ